VVPCPSYGSGVLQGGHVAEKGIRLIVNPAAGGGNATRAVPRIRRWLTEQGSTFDVVRTQHPMHAVELARGAVAEGYGTVVAVGGDGTANEVLNGLMQAKESGEGDAALGILCVGRGNDFAYGAGIPADLQAGCRTLLEGNHVSLDIGRVNGPQLSQARFFGNGVGIGFDTVVGLEAAKLKRLRGFAGYFVAALKTIFLYFDAPRVTIRSDGASYEQQALMVSIMNGCRLGGGFMMAPDASMVDGELDLCIAQHVGRLKVFALIARFMRGTQARHPAITMHRTKRVVVTAVQGALPAHADGELLCEEGLQLEIEIVPQAIQVLCGASGGRG